MKSIAELLEQHPFLRGLAPQAIRFIAGCAKNERYEAGQYIFREGEPADWFHLVREGTVSLEAHVPGRGPVSFLTVKAGEILGAAWIAPPYRWLNDARALEVTRTTAFDAACLRAKCESDPALGYELMKRFLPPLIERLQAARLQALDVYGKRER
jgi:CRP-like cAMP-binding protein